MRVLTVGHSTRTFDELVGFLRAFTVDVLVDVRTVPRSRHNPQFNQDTLATALPAQGIRYVHMTGLGGLRHARKDSPNMGWHNDSFRGFADYMQTAEFRAALVELRTLAGQGQLALMCAEAVPWRCHRSLIADALTAAGAHVEHITSGSSAHASARPHRLTPFARVVGGRVTYPSPAPS